MSVIVHVGLHVGFLLFFLCCFQWRTILRGRLEWEAIFYAKLLFNCCRREGIGVPSLRMLMQLAMTCMREPEVYPSSLSLGLIPPLKMKTGSSMGARGIHYHPHFFLRLVNMTVRFLSRGSERFTHSQTLIPH